MTLPGGVCTRRVGFLFPRECGRTSPIGCRDCENGQIADPYGQRKDRYGYSDYDDYNDFTEADGQSVVKRRPAFEEDMSAS